MYPEGSVIGHRGGVSGFICQLLLKSGQDFDFPAVMGNFIGVHGAALLEAAIASRQGINTQKKSTNYSTVKELEGKTERGGGENAAVESLAELRRRATGDGG